MFGKKKEKPKTAKKPIVTFEERAKKFMAQDSMQINEIALNNLRAYFSNFINIVNTAHRHNQPIAQRVRFDIGQPELHGMTWEQALEFVRYDFTATTLQRLCMYYGYHIWIKEKAGGIYVCISNSAEYVKEFEYQVTQSYS